MKKIILLSNKTKKEVLKKQNYKCSLDNERLINSFNFFQIDENKPKDTSNIIALCSYCIDALKCQE